MAGKASSGQLRLEVEELTAMMRSDETFSDLRRLLSEHGLDPHTHRLAGLVEGEDGSEGGVLVTPVGRAVVYERDALNPSSGFTVLRTVEQPSELLDQYPAVVVALDLS